MDKVTINLLDVEGKARSKAELYKLLTVEGHLYLPPYKYCSVDFIADIIEGKRKALETKEVVIRNLPHITCLRTEDLVSFLVDDCECDAYLPSKFKTIVLHRDWISNLCNSLNPAAFDDYVQNKLYNQQQKFIKKKCLSIQVVSKFANLFKSSTMVSTHKGKSHLMLNRKRRYEREAEELEAREKESTQESLIHKLSEEVKLLKNEIEEAKLEQAENSKNADILNELYEKNIIDADGNVL